jgi:transmembrane sensor
MTQTIPEKKSRSTIKVEAADWFAKLRSADFNLETQQDFEQWMMADQAHELAFEQCRALWAITASLESDADIQRELAGARQLIRSQSRKQEKTKQQRGLLTILASSFKFASVALLLIVGFGFAYNLVPLTNEHYETRVGEQRVVQLADGSTATLNTDTEISVKFTAKKRRIELVKGEAYFAVSKDRQRPFEVVTSTGLVRAVGTEFNVAVFAHALAVDVAEGIVQLEAATATDPVAKVIAEIKHGEAVKYHRGDKQAVIKAANLTRISAWKASKIYFNANTVAEAVAEYNRYIKERIVVVDNELNEQQITGVFNLGDLDTFTFSLEQALDARVERKQDLILVMKNK